MNQDPGGLLSGRLHDWLASSNSVRLVELDAAAAEAQVGQGKLAGALLVPAGFSQKILAGELAQLTLLANPASPSGQALFQLLRRPVTQLMSAAEIARLDVRQTASRWRSANLNLCGAATFAAAAQAWEQARQAATGGAAVAIRQEPGDPYGGNPYNQSSPGILVMFSIFRLVTAGQVLLQERKSGTLQRMRTTSIQRWQIILGHLLAIFALVLLQAALLVVFGQLLLKVNYLRQPLGTLLVAVGLSLWVAALGLLIGVIAKADDQVILYSMVFMFVFSALGGTWFPLEGAGKTFAALGRLTPGAWAMDGFQDILIRGLGVSAIWPGIGVMLVYAIGFFLLAAWRFGREA